MQIFVSDVKLHLQPELTKFGVTGIISQAIMLWRLQTRTYPNTPLNNRIYLEVCVPTTCDKCHNTIDLAHMLLHRSALRNGSENTEERWHAALCSFTLEEQLWAVQRACEVAERLGLSVPMWERPTLG